MNDLTAFLLGRSLGSNIARQREQERQDRERHHRELLAALEKQSRQSRRSSTPVVITIHCPFCNKTVPVAYFNGHRGCSECNRQIEGLPADAPIQNRTEKKIACRHCKGHILYPIADYGGKQIACPHCAKQIRLPKA